MISPLLVIAVGWPTTTLCLGGALSCALSIGEAGELTVTIVDALSLSAEEFAIVTTAAATTEFVLLLLLPATTVRTGDFTGVTICVAAVDVIIFRRLFCLPIIVAVAAGGGVVVGAIAVVVADVVFNVVI